MENLPALYEACENGNLDEVTRILANVKNKALKKELINQHLSLCSKEDIDIVKYLEDSAKFMTESHSALEKKDTHLHNIIDEIVALLYQTLYKLKNLK